MSSVPRLECGRVRCAQGVPRGILTTLWRDNARPARDMKLVTRDAISRDSTTRYDGALRVAASGVRRALRLRRGLSVSRSRLSPRSALAVGVCRQCPCGRAPRRRCALASKENSHVSATQTHRHASPTQPLALHHEDSGLSTEPHPQALSWCMYSCTVARGR